MTTTTTQPADPATRTPAIDAEHLERQRQWSARTFGPGPRTLGVLDHIRKELDEIEADPTDKFEWADVIILGFDGALRAGLDPQTIIDAIREKQARNEARVWPDWRTADPNKAIEHVRVEHVRVEGGPGPVAAARIVAELEATSDPTTIYSTEEPTS